MPEQRSAATLGPDEGAAVRARGDVYICKAAAAQTEGHYSLFEARHAPGGGVPPHRHSLDEESFYILEGRYRFWVGEESLELGPGDFAHVPRPSPHAFENVGETTARMLIVIAPGGYHERYFEEAWQPVADLRRPPAPEPPDFERIAAAASRAGIELLPGGARTAG